MRREPGLMSDAPQTTPSADESMTKGAPRYGGALAGIAQRHEEIRSEKTLDLQIPGYEGKMKVRYRLLPEAEMDRLADRIDENTRGASGMTVSLEVEADMLVAMCDRVFVREPEQEDAAWQVLEDETGPVRFEGRFAAILKQAGATINDTRARETVLDFFSPREDPSNPTSPRTQPQAIEAHTNALVLWHRGQKESISRRLLGE